MDKSNKQKEKSPRDNTRNRDPFICLLRHPVITVNWCSEVRSLQWYHWVRFLLAIWRWAHSLPLKVVCFPSETPLEKTTFPSANHYQQGLMQQYFKWVQLFNPLDLFSFVLCFGRDSIIDPSYPETCFIVHTGLEFTILLPPKYWYTGCVPPPRLFFFR